MLRECCRNITNRGSATSVASLQQFGAPKKKPGVAGLFDLYL
jgi:hypothetical protein